MKTKSDSLKKFILIGLSLFLYKSVFLVYAYSFNQAQYNLFNQFYYTASLLILFGSMGFNIAQTRIPINTLRLFLIVSINTIITYSVLQFVSLTFSDIKEIISVIVYSVFVSVGGVLSFKLLFDGKYKIYSLVMLMFAVAHFMLIAVVKFFNLNLFLTLVLFIVIWFFAVYRFFDKEISEKKSYKEYYKIGFSAFVINSAVSLALAADKFIANHFFEIDIANAYTFAWGLTAPIFYIGNLIEKYLYAELKPDKNRILRKGFLFSLLLISTYTVGILIVINFFPSLLPGSVSNEIFGSIFTFMITGYSLYVIFHFPLNTYLFKVSDTKKQKTVSVYFFFIILIFAFVFYYIINNAFEFNYQLLLITVWIYIFTLLIVKALIIFRGSTNNSSITDQIIPEEMKEIP